MVLANEVYTGAGLSATMVPEMDFELSEAFGSVHNTTHRLVKTPTSGGDLSSLTWTLSDDNRLVKDMYKGCLAKIESYGTTSGSAAPSNVQNTLMIKSNTANSIVFNQAIGAADEYFACTILSYGAPVYAPAVIEDKVNLLADNWLGLVNTVTPPTVDVEMKQSNLALGGTRNFGHQFKGAETLGAASIDVSLNNGMWLYYALGGIHTLEASSLHASSDLNDVSSGTHNLTVSSGGDWFASTTDKSIRRAEKGVDGNVVPLPDLAKGSTRANWKLVNSANYFTYAFKESNSGDLPSFTLEVTAEKGAVTDAGYTHIDGEETLFSRIYTGCQVNSLSMNFEEGQDVKATVDAVARKAHDSEAEYTPKRRVRTPSALFNYNAEADNNPFMFSDGHVELFGQTLARVKSGSLTITNNLTPQRFIGNYDRTITSTHIAGQRTYDVTLNMLITDRELWDNLRKPRADTSTYSDDTDEISNSQIILKFDKSGTTADSDYIEIKLDNYIVQSVDIPFPEDKGMIEASLTLSARTMTAGNCKYVGKWAIQM